MFGFQKRRLALARVETLCKEFDCGRGIWKQIDENRQLLQFLFSEFPEIKERASFIESWIADTDLFLNCLVEVLELEQPHPEALPYFPRAWPGSYEDPQVYAQKIVQHIMKKHGGK